MRDSLQLSSAGLYFRGCFWSVHIPSQYKRLECCWTPVSSTLAIAGTLGNGFPERPPKTEMCTMPAKTGESEQHRTHTLLDPQQFAKCKEKSYCNLTVPVEAIWMVCITVFIDSLGGSISAPVMPFYAREFNASSSTIGLLFSTYSLAQVIALPLLGRLSDHIGRRPVWLG
eukprot:g32683.t1